MTQCFAFLALGDTYQLPGQFRSLIRQSDIDPASISACFDPSNPSSRNHFADDSTQIRLWYQTQCLQFDQRLTRTINEAGQHLPFRQQHALGAQAAMEGPRDMRAGLHEQESQVLIGDPARSIT